MSDLDGQLDRALFEKNLEGARAAIDGGASIATDSSGTRSPLGRAAGRNFSAGVELLLSQGADPNVADMTGATPLFHAASPKVAKLLIEAGASTDTRDQKGRTALHTVAIKHAATVPFLLQQGMDPNARDSEDKTPLEAACFHLVKKSVEALLTSGDLDPEIGARALRAAARDYSKKALQIVDLLLARGADPNGLGSPADTPLLAAIHAGGKDVVAALLAAGADPNTPNEAGEAPIHAAAHNRLVDVCRALVNAGADPRARCGDAHPDPSRRRKSALEIAEAKGRQDLLAALQVPGK